MNAAASVFFLLICLTTADKFLVVLSERTPEFVQEVVVENLTGSGLSGFQVEFVEFARFKERMIVEDEANIVLDASYSGLVSADVSRLCSETSKLHLLLWPSDTSSMSSWTYSLCDSFPDLSQAIKSVKSYFHFQSLNVFCDLSEFSLYFTKNLHSDERTEYDVTFFTEEMEEMKAVGKIIRPKGNRVSIFTTSPKTTKKLLKAQSAMHVGGVGYGNVMPLFSALYELTEEDTESTLRTGNVVVAERTVAEARTPRQYFELIVARVDRYLSQYRSSDSLRSRLSLDLHPSVRSSSYVVLNHQAGSWKLVGQVSNWTYSPISEVWFLGNTTDVPRNATAPILISGNFGNTDPIGYYYPMQPMYGGALLALADVNKRTDILPTFSLDLWNFTGGYSRYNETYLNSAIIPQRDKFGAAMIASIASTFNLPFLKLMRRLNDSTPVVGSATTFPALSVRKDFQNFIRTAVSDSFMNIVIIQIFKRFGWTKCGMVFENNTMGRDAQQQFQKLMSESGITIVNSPTDQILSATVSSISEAIGNYSESLQRLIDTRARVLLVITVYVGKYVPVVLYELGLRRGDVILIGREWISNYAFDSLSPSDILKAGEVMRGALQFSPDRFVGEFGQRVAARFKEVYHATPSSYSCFYYDSALTIGLALDWLVYSGQDYMNHTLMMTALRETRFTGCTGIVSFEQSSNDRNQVRFVLETIVLNTSVATMARAGLYDPHGMVLLSIEKNFTWPDGTIKVPKDERNSTIGCPFEDRLNSTFPLGQYIAILLTSLFSIFTVIICGVLWCLLRKRPLEHLVERREIEIEDVSVMFGALIEVLQYLSLGPTLEFISDQFQVMLDATVWNGERFLPLKGGGFEKLWIFAQASVAVWASTALLGLFAGYRRKSLRILSYLIENWLFTPIVSVLMDVFLCRSGVAAITGSVTFLSSYLEADCYVSCWRGSHIWLFVLSAVSLVVFIPVAALRRAVWPESQRNLHIKWSVGSVMVKTALSVSVVSISKIAKSSIPLLHAGVFISLFLAYLVYCLYYPCFGYARMRLWHCIAIAVVVWSAAISMAEQATADRSLDLMFLSLALCGWTAFVSLGVVYQRVRLPSLLYRPEGINTLYLFKFAFQRANETILTNLQAEFSRVGYLTRSVRGSRHGMDSVGDLQYSSQQGGS